MANEYSEAYQSFESLVEGGVHVEQSNRTVDTVKELYEEDEVLCENMWQDHIDAEGLSGYISVEDILGGECTKYVLERHAHNNFTNGNHKDFIANVEEIGDDFLDYLEEEVEEKDELKMLRRIAHNFL